MGLHREIDHNAQQSCINCMLADRLWPNAVFSAGGEKPPSSDSFVDSETPRGCVPLVSRFVFRTLYAPRFRSDARPPSSPRYHEMVSGIAYGTLIAGFCSDIYTAAR